MSLETVTLSRVTAVLVLSREPHEGSTARRKASRTSSYKWNTLFALPHPNYFPSQFHIPWKAVNTSQRSQLFTLWFNTRVTPGGSLCHPQAQADYICKASVTCGHVPRVNPGRPFLTFALVAALPPTRHEGSRAVCLLSPRAFLPSLPPFSSSQVSVDRV